MAVERLMLEIPAKIAEMMKNGTAYRDGGIVREVDTKRIVGFLKDTDASQSELVNANVVPLAMMGVSMMAINHRLNKIEASIRSLKKDIEGAFDAIEALLLRKIALEEKLVELNHPELIKK
mgnify:CR=1 FL=1